MDIKLRVDRQILKRTGIEKVKKEGNEPVNLIFDFSKEWRSLNKTAQITSKDHTVNVPLVNNRCQVPKEKYENTDFFYVSVFGGVLLPSTKTKIEVE